MDAMTAKTDERSCITESGGSRGQLRSGSGACTHPSASADRAGADGGPDVAPDGQVLDPVQPVQQVAELGQKAGPPRRDIDIGTRLQQPAVPDELKRGLK